MSTSTLNIIDTCELFLSTCFNKSIIKKVSTYSVQICVSENILTASRNQYRSETDAIIESFQNMDSIYQIATSIRNCSTEIQYFIYERVSLIRCMANWYPDKYPVTLDPCTSICTQISHMLLALWEYTEMLCQGNLNSAVSQCHRSVF